MEFVSKLEEMMKAEELMFEPTPGFGKYRKYLEHAINHPAKINTDLLEFLISTFTKEGDVILDPMAGSGSTGVVAALHGRNAIQVDIERRFYEFMEKARENVEKTPTLTPKGWIRNICGDSRNLSKLLQEADICITSPPYTNSAAENLNVSRYRKGGMFAEEKLVDVAITSPPYLKSAEQGAGVNRQRDGDVRIGCSTVGRMVTHPEAVDNIKQYGDVDIILTSPPYGESYLGGGDVEKRRERLVKAGYNPKDFLGGKARNAVLKHYSEIDAVITSPPYERQHQGGADIPKVKHGCVKEKYPSQNNIANLPLGNIDTIITSPPYAETLQGKPEDQKHICETPPPEGAVRKYRRKPVGYGYSESGDNIGNLPLGNIDAIITSPPYLNVDNVKEDGGEFWRRAKEEGRRWGSKPPAGTGEKQTISEGNVANLPLGEADDLKSQDGFEVLVRRLMTKSGKPTYLSEMLKIYREMWKVLKPGGLAIVVVKPFIRRRQIVDLPYHTYILMSRCGFTLEKLYKLRLKNTSFWRILYYRRNPSTPRIAHEWILVCRKPPLNPFQTPYPTSP
jgi:DNA modification methylase